MKNIVKLLAVLMVVIISIIFCGCNSQECKHEWGECVIISQPTCGQQGIAMYVCLHCGESKSEYIETNGVHINNDNDDICDICKEDIYATLVEYSLSQDAQSYIVTGIGQARTKVKIMPKYNDLPVTRISTIAFSGCDNLVKVEMPDSITVIGDKAFYGCSKLTSVQMSKNVISIGVSAFSGCKLLEKIEIPNTITFIGENAFAGCNNLKYNEFGNTKYLGNDDNSYLCLIEASVLTYCNVHKDTKFICKGAFSLGYYTLKSVMFQNTSGWYVDLMTAEGVDMKIDVEDPYKNATNLKSTYRGYMWYKM